MISTKKIYFLSDKKIFKNSRYYYFMKDIYKKYLENIKKSNTKIYINGTKKSFSNYFIPKSEGIDSIKLVFDIKII